MTVKPITPDEAERGVEQVIGPEVDKLVTRINEALKVPPPYLSSSWTVSPAGAKSAVVHRVMSLFRSAGWDVTWVDDQREGSYLTFKRSATSHPYIMER